MRRTTITFFAVIIATCCAFSAWAASSDAPPSADKLPAADPAMKSKTTEVDIVCPTSDEAARRLFNEAINLAGQGRYGEAKEKYVDAIGKDPRYCDAMDNLGLLFRREGDIGQAIHWYERSIAVKPDNAVAHQNLAVAYRIQGDAEKTIAEYQWLVENNPENPEGFYGLGMTYLALDRLQDAVKPLERAEELYRASSSPLIGDARHLLGVAFFGLKEYSKARDYLTLSYPEMENDADVNYLLGLCYLESPIKDVEKAREYLLKAQQLGKQLSPEQLRALDYKEGTK